MKPVSQSTPNRRSVRQSPTQRRHSWRFGPALVLGGAILLTTACGQDQSTRSFALNDTTKPASGLEVNKESDRSFAVGDAKLAGDSEPTQPGPTTIRREMIYTANADVEVADATAAANRLRKAVIGDGGYVLQDERSEGSARMVLRIKPEQFDATLAGLTKAGKVRSQSINASDVTADMVDLEARLKSATISRDRLRALLNGAVKVDDIIKLETELSTRESTVEQLQGQLNVIRNQVGFATITVSLSQRSVAVLNDDNTTPTEGFKNGWVALRNFGEGLLVFLATIAAWVPFLVIGGLLLRFTGRRWRKSHPAKPAAAMWTPYVPTTPAPTAPTAPTAQPITTSENAAESPETAFEQGKQVTSPS
jgi:hypothetical protein